MKYKYKIPLNNLLWAASSSFVASSLVIYQAFNDPNDIGTLIFYTSLFIGLLLLIPLVLVIAYCTRSWNGRCIEIDNERLIIPSLFIQKASCILIKDIDKTEIIEYAQSKTLFVYSKTGKKLAIDSKKSFEVSVEELREIINRMKDLYRS